MSELTQRIASRYLSSAEDWFYLVLPLDFRSGTYRPAHMVGRSLANREFDGLEGVSGSNRILLRGRKNDKYHAMLKMPRAGVLEKNDLEPIPYGDVDALLADGMRLYRRISGAGGSLEYLLTVLSYVNGSDATSEAAADLLYELDDDKVAHYMALDTLPDSAGELAEDLVFAAKQTMSLDDDIGKAFDAKPEDVEPAVREAVRSSVEMLESEEEWIVESSRFKVPGGSILYVGVPDKRIIRYVREGRLFGPELPDPHLDAFEYADEAGEHPYPVQDIRRTHLTLLWADRWGLESKYEVVYMDLSKLDDAAPRFQRVSL